MSATPFLFCVAPSGVDVPASVQKALMMRYSDKEGNVRFDDFVSCYIKLKSMMSTTELDSMLRFNVICCGSSL